jgi:hypothetical protein
MQFENSSGTQWIERRVKAPHGLLNGSARQGGQIAMASAAENENSSGTR